MLVYSEQPYRLITTCHRRHLVYNNPHPYNTCQSNMLQLDKAYTLHPYLQRLLTQALHNPPHSKYTISMSAVSRHLLSLF
jgi:hypothetical protein